MKLLSFSYFFGGFAAVAVACFLVGEGTAAGQWLAGSNSAEHLMDTAMFAMALPGSLLWGWLGGCVLLALPLGLLRRQGLSSQLATGVAAGIVFDALGVFDYMTQKGQFSFDTLNGLTGTWPASLAAQNWARGHSVAAIVELIAPPVAGFVAAYVFHRFMTAMDEAKA
jgi:hypothetical protein